MSQLPNWVRNGGGVAWSGVGWDGVEVVCPALYWSGVHCGGRVGCGGVACGAEKKQNEETENEIMRQMPRNHYRCHEINMIPVRGP